ncbi:glycosyltransferase family 8 protein [Helicobacter sp. T3_23-1059]
MFHICFCANEAYIKYTAVLIASIIKATDTTKSFSDYFYGFDTKISDKTRERERESNLREIGTFANIQKALDSYPKQNFESLSKSQKCEGYIFHIFSDFVSQESRTKLQNLAKDLSKIYPCEIKIHICNDELFAGLPTLNGNYLTYFRFFIPRFMPKEAQICLYLDIDMLVLGDLRGLFALDMGESCVGIVKDRLNKNNAKKLRSKTPNAKDIYFAESYFNAGFLLINLNAWERQNIAQKCFEIMANYHLSAHDQDALNAAIADCQRLYLPFGFNLLVYSYIFASCKDEALRYKFDFTREQMNLAIKNPVILHFAGGYKSWSNFWIKNAKGTILSNIWWEIAFQTPHFSEILRKDFEALKQNPHKIFESQSAIYLLNHTRKNGKFLGFFSFFTLPFITAKIFNTFEREIAKLSNFKNLDSKNIIKHLHKILESQGLDFAKLDSSDLSPSDYNFAFELYALAQKSWKRRKKGDLLILPFKAIKLKIRHKRYGITRVIKADIHA